MTIRNNLKIQSSSTPEVVLRLLASLAWAGIILCLSLTSSPPQIPGVLGWDKLLHTGAYGLLTLLIAIFLSCFPLEPRKLCWFAWLAAVSFGALMEVMQLLAQTGRTAEWWDLFADALGALLACVLFRQVHGLICRWKQPAEKNHG